MSGEADNKISVIIGLGVTGLSCARFLAARGVAFKVVDSRENPPGLAVLLEQFPDVEYELGSFQEETLNAARELIVSPGVSLKTPAIAHAVKRGVAVTSDIDIFSKQSQKPIIAVTGSNGKSTVVAILAKILTEAGMQVGLGGNLDMSSGKPALDLLLEPDTDIYVLELSSFQLETTENLHAEVATILNVSEDHMDRYDSLEQYHRAKLRIFNGCHKIVVNRDSPYSKPDDRPGAKVWEFGLGRPGVNGVGLLEDGDDQYLAYQSEKIMPVGELKVVGQHNMANVLAAIALALAVDVDLGPIRRAVSRFSGLPHRCQWVARVNGVDFYNDSKGTNVGATVAAIAGLGQSLTGRIVLIAGGVGKGADFRPLLSVISRWGKAVVLIGQDAEEIATALAPDMPCHFAADMNAAVQTALAQARPGDAILLSPACASHDMFENFEHRGHVFVQTVETLQ